MKMYTRFTSILASVFAASALAIGGMGCAHTMTPNGPNNVSGSAATTTTGVDSTGNAAPGTATGTAGTRTPDPSEPPGVQTGSPIDQRQNVNGTVDGTTPKQMSPGNGTNTGAGVGSGGTGPTGPSPGK
jgi:hypothetical protein